MYFIGRIINKKIFGKFSHILCILYIKNKYIFMKIQFVLNKLNHIVLVYPRVVRIIKSQPFHVNLYFLHKIHIGISSCSLRQQIFH